jgi:hypothetical protein
MPQWPPTLLIARHIGLLRTQREEARTKTSQIEGGLGLREVTATSLFTNQREGALSIANMQVCSGRARPAPKPLPH